MTTRAMTLTVDTDTALRFSKLAHDPQRQEAKHQTPQHQSGDADPAVASGAVASGLDARQVRLFYWQKLVREGVPKPEAKAIAVAIAQFDRIAKQPSPIQQRLIAQYSPNICRAHLWQSALLLP